MSNVRFVKEAYPLYLSMDFNKLPNLILKKIRDSSDFVGVRLDCEEVAHSFCVYYATENGRNEIADWLCNLGFENQVLVPFFKDGNQSVQFKREFPVYADYKNDPMFREWMSNKNKEYNDILNIDNSEYGKVLDVIYPELESKRILMSDLVDPKKLPFPRITIHFKDKDKTLKLNCVYQIESNTLFIEAEREGEKMFKVKYTIEKIDDENSELFYKTDLIYKGEFYPDNGLLVPITKTFNEYEEHDELNVAMWHFFFVNYFVRVLPGCYTKTIKKQEEIFSEGKGNKKRYKTKIVLKSHYEVSFKNYSVKHIRHIFKCLCWGVRGHYRHYKNGKVVFVQAFRKGKERNNLSAFSEKEYKL